MRKEGSIYEWDWEIFSFLFALDKNQDVSVCRVVTSRSGFVVDSWRRITASDSSRPAPNPASTWRRWAMTELLKRCRCVCVPNTAKVNPSSFLLLCFYSLSCSRFCLWRRRSYRSPRGSRYVVWRRACHFTIKSLFLTPLSDCPCSYRTWRERRWKSPAAQRKSLPSVSFFRSDSCEIPEKNKNKTQEENVFCLHLVGQRVQSRLLYQNSTFFFTSLEHLQELRCTQINLFFCHCARAKLSTIFFKSFLLQIKPPACPESVSETCFPPCFCLRCFFLSNF